MFLYEIFQNNFEILTAEFFLTVIILILLLFGTYLVNSTKKTNRLPIILINQLVVYFLIWDLFLMVTKVSVSTTLLNGVLLTDDFIQFMHIGLLLVTIFFFFIQKEYILQTKLLKFENSILILLSLLGLLFLTASYNLITLYLSIEIQSLCFYILAATRTKSYFSIESALKYFILGAIASGFILYGSSIIYLATGSLSFSNIVLILSNLHVSMGWPYYAVLIYGLMFLLTGLLFKIGAVPFHSWLPDVYEGTPNNITTFFAIAPKLALFSILFRLCFDIFHEIMTLFEMVFYFSALFSIVLGSLVALQQTKFKRLFAYSTIGHTGFLLIGFASNTFQDLKYILFYLIVYTLMSINVWTILIGLTTKNISWQYLTDLTNIFKRNTGLTVLFLITLLSLAGIPPLLGFFSKMFIFFLAIQNNMNSLAILGVIVGVISTFYYIKLIKITYFDQPTKKTALLDAIPKANSYIISICSLFLLILPFFINLILTYFEQLTLILII